MTDADKETNPLHFGSDRAYPDWDQSGYRDSKPGSFLVEVSAKWLALAEPRCLGARLVTCKLDF